jgi:hypothetical protein
LAPTITLRHAGITAFANNPALKLQALEAFKGPSVKLAAVESIAGIARTATLRHAGIAAFANNPALKLQALEAFGGPFGAGFAARASAVADELLEQVLLEPAAEGEPVPAQLRAWYRTLSSGQRRNLEDALLALVFAACSLTAIVSDRRELEIIAHVMGVCLAVIVLLSRVQDTLE